MWGLIKWLLLILSDEPKSSGNGDEESNLEPIDIGDLPWWETAPTMFNELDED